jgi:histidine triad (HIT) family protein
MSVCPFCARIAARQYEREWVLPPSHGHVVAFAPLNPVTPGHMLVVPQAHVPDAAHSPDVTASVMFAAAILAGEVGSCNIITSVGESATQSVFHLHVHVVPRRFGDGLALPWTGQQRIEEKR